MVVSEHIIYSLLHPAHLATRLIHRPSRSEIDGDALEASIWNDNTVALVEEPPQQQQQQEEASPCVDALFHLSHLAYGNVGVSHYASHVDAQNGPQVHLPILVPFPDAVAPHECESRANIF
jgi:hypothetical protein